MQRYFGLPIFLPSRLILQRCSTLENVSREIKNECGFCGKHIAFPEEGIGQTVACPECGKSIVLGLNPVEASESNSPSDYAVQAPCPHCARRIVFPSFLASDMIICPYCDLAVFWGDTKFKAVPISRSQMDALLAASQQRMAEQKNREPAERKKREQQLLEKYRAGQAADSVFTFISCVIVLVVILAIVVAFAKWVLFWDFQ